MQWNNGELLCYDPLRININEVYCFKKNVAVIGLVVFLVPEKQRVFYILEPINGDSFVYNSVLCTIPDSLNCPFLMTFRAKICIILALLNKLFHWARWSNAISALWVLFGNPFSHIMQFLRIAGDHVENSNTHKKRASKVRKLLYFICLRLFNLCVV